MRMTFPKVRAFSIGRLRVLFWPSPIRFYIGRDEDDLWSISFERCWFFAWANGWPTGFRTPIIREWHVGPLEFRLARR